MKIFHFYPDLMNLYGSAANVWALRRALEAVGCQVTVEPVAPGQDPDLTDADLIYMGAGTERAQKAALADFVRFADGLKAAEAAGVAMLFAGNAMELLGKTITAADGTVYNGLGLADFTTVQGKQRIAEDVYGRTALFEEPVVGFINKSGIVSGVETPLLTAVSLGFGNERAGGAEGFCRGNVLASQLTGPLLVKNPKLLEHVVTAVCARRGVTVPAPFPHDPYALSAWAVTEEQLRRR